MVVPCERLSSIITTVECFLHYFSLLKIAKTFFFLFREPASEHNRSKALLCPPIRLISCTAKLAFMTKLKLNNAKFAEQLN